MKKNLAITILIVIFLVVIIILIINANSSINPFAVKNPFHLKKYSNTLIEFPPNEVEDIHYPSSKITYTFVNENICGRVEAIRIRKAFSEIQNQTNNAINFTEINWTADTLAYIEINCSKNVPLGEKKGFIVFGNAFYAIKENLITKGCINLYNCGINMHTPGCSNFPDVEIHEILHTLGVGHVDNSSSIMLAEYNHCKYKIDKDIIDYLIRIYSGL
jgi:predicted Zn-dependent protease